MQGHFYQPQYQPEISAEEKTWAMLCHLAGLAVLVIPFGNIFGPLILWAMKKDQSTWVNAHGREALNFQLSLTIYALLSLPLIFVLIGIPMLLACGLGGFILPIIAGVRAGNGERFRYPLTIRFFG